MLTQVKPHIYAHHECTGNRGIRFCADKYPSGMLPTDEFTELSVDSGTCRTCRKAMNDVRKHLYAYAGASSEEYYRLTQSVRDKVYGVIWASLYEDRDVRIVASPAVLSKGLQMAITIAGCTDIEAFYALTDAAKEEALETAESMMAGGRTEVSAKQNTDRRGFVYIVTNPAYPGFVKIGKALNPDSRLMSYQTYSPHRDYVMEDVAYFADRAKAETLLKGLLSHDQGIGSGEWYEVALETARDALEMMKEVAIW